MKICKDCGLEKEFSEFGKSYNNDNKLIVYYKNACRKCSYKKNKIKILEYFRNNKDILTSPASKLARNSRDRNRRRVDPLFNLKNNTRSLINTSLKSKGFDKKSKTSQILGCSFEDFKLYIESKFEIWMNWENHGEYTGNYNETWQYDHIIPISSAKNEEDIIKLNHYTNLQPLCSKKNIIDKNRKLDYNI